MDRNNFRLTYEALDADGNGQRITFEQLGLTEDQLLTLQAEVVRPCVAALDQITGAWLTAAQAKVKVGKAGGSASSTQDAK